MLEGAKSIGAGAATIALAGAAVGIGSVFSSLIHSVARNPSLSKPKHKQLFGYAKAPNGVPSKLKTRLSSIFYFIFLIFLFQ